MKGQHAELGGPKRGRRRRRRRRRDRLTGRGSPGRGLVPVLSVPQSTAYDSTVSVTSRTTWLRLLQAGARDPSKMRS